MADVFISYATVNAEVAKHLCNDFEEAGLRCWIAPRDIKPGTEYGAEIIRGLETSRILLLCLSKESNESQHVMREVERAVNRNMPIITYQYEQVELSKSLEYFLSSTQWFFPKGDNDSTLLIDAIQSLNVEQTEINMKSKNVSGTSSGKKSTFIIIAAVLLCFLAFGGIFMLLNTRNIVISDISETNKVQVGDEITYGQVVNARGSQAIPWTIVEINEKDEYAVCLASQIIAFQPYDAAESGYRGKDDAGYYAEELFSEYSDERLAMFWGNSDWSTSNIRTWLNSDEQKVTYYDMAPVSLATSGFINEYDANSGFLYAFTQEERDRLMTVNVYYTGIDGTMRYSEDKVYLLSKEEAETYLLSDKSNVADPASVLSAQALDNAIKNDGTGIYELQMQEGKDKFFWALRDYGDIRSCTILCAGAGLRNKNKFHSEYACTSHLGIRPVIVLPLSYLNSK